MPLQQLPLRPIQLDYVCDECGEGHYRPTGTSLMSNPPQYPHRCDKCDHPHTFNERFPTIRYCKEGELLNLDDLIQ